MKRYHRGSGGKDKEFPEVDAFLNEIIQVCKKYNMCIVPYAERYESLCVTNLTEVREQDLLEIAVNDDYECPYIPGITTDAS